MPIYEQFEKAVEGMRKGYEAVREISDPIVFGAWLGAIIDQWAADHNATMEEMAELINGLAGAHAYVNKEFGPMPKSV